MSTREHHDHEVAQTFLRAELHQFLEGRDRNDLWTLLFSSMPGEPDFSGLTTRAGVGSFALTRTPEQSMGLTLHPWGSEKERHPYGFDQPVKGSPIVPHHQIDVVLVPGLAFDADGGRLGFGAGYYDRLLGRLNDSSENRRLPLVMIGVSFSPLVEAVPTEEHDVAMTHILNGEGLRPIVAVG